MPFDLSVPSQLMAALGPEILFMAGACVLLLWSAWEKQSLEHQRRVGVASMALTAVTGAYVMWNLYQGRTATGGPIAVDAYRWLADAVILLGTLFSIGLMIDDNDRQGVTAAETHVMILLASAGMMLMAGAQDLMLVFLGIELMSLSVYALAAVNRRSGRGAEGALKYFLLGAFSTAFLLYGMALIYGATGTTNLADIGVRIQTLQLQHNGLLLIGTGLLLVGFAFKIAAVPFHMWAPDVYDGAPTAVTAYMAALVKAAAFVALLRIWMECFHETLTLWSSIVGGLAAATMIVGNLVGLAQRNIKRMLAYSSIAHAGYLLVALSGGSAQAGSAVLFYLLAYSLATFGAFGIVIVLSQSGDKPIMVRDFHGLWTVRPWLALGMGVSLLSMMGFPIFGGAGFFAKWYVLQAALQAPIPQVTLAVLLVLTTVVSAGYYLYVVMVMFMKPRPEGTTEPPVSPMLTRAVVVCSVVAVLLLGVVPEQFVRLARAGTMEAVPTAPAVTASATRP